MTYDQKCYDLGALFLVAHPEISNDENRDLLAQEIQDVIECFIDARTPAQCLTCSTISITCRPCAYCKEPVCDSCEEEHLAHHRADAGMTLAFRSGATAPKWPEPNAPQGTETQDAGGSWKKT